VFSTYCLLQVFLAEYRISTSPKLGELFFLRSKFMSLFSSKLSFCNLQAFFRFLMISFRS
jgi:hypothetical protein